MNPSIREDENDVRGVFFWWDVRFVYERMFGFLYEKLEVIISKERNVKTIVLNRPHALNALNLNMTDSIIPHFIVKESEDEKFTSPIIMMKGSGEKAFCSGGDVKGKMDENEKKKKKIHFFLVVAEQVKKEDVNAADFFRREYQLNHLIGTYRGPCIAIMNGITSKLRKRW
jgi:enoyl-CoA hydratase/carnithine racemase